MRGNSKLIRPSDVLLAIGGPVAMGAVIGMQFNLFFLVREAAILPLIVCGVAIMMIPVLYIGLNLVDVAPSVRQVAMAVLRGARISGVVLLGLVPPTIFLLATTQNGVLVNWLGATLLATAACAALRVLYMDLFGGQSVSIRAASLFAAWSLVSMGIGASLYFDTLIR